MSGAIYVALLTKPACPLCHGDRLLSSGHGWRPCPACSPYGSAPDTRPAQGLWAPGDYLCQCMTCHKLFAGDKRAHQCQHCAYAEPTKQRFDISARQSNVNPNKQQKDDSQ